jgi:hypothetical protein
MVKVKGIWAVFTACKEGVIHLHALFVSHEDARSNMPFE